MPLKTLAALSAALLLAGCMTTTSQADDTGLMTPAADCQVDTLEDYQGRTYSDALRDTLMHKSHAQQVRVIRPGDMYTADYQSDRLNIHLDEDDRITEMRCG